MKKITNIKSDFEGLYFLQDNDGEIVAATTSVESLIRSFQRLMSCNNQTGYAFLKLVNNRVVYVDDNELPDWFLENAEDDEFDDYDPYHSDSGEPPILWM